MTHPLPSPPARLESLPDDLLAGLSAAFDSGEPDPQAQPWAEKLRRFVELNGGRLTKVAAARFGADHSRTVLAGIATVLTKASASTPDGSPDLPCLNAAFRALDALGRNAPAAARARAERLLAATRAAIASRTPAPAATDEPYDDLPPIAEKYRLVLICRQGALYGAVVRHLLRARGVEPAALVVVEARGWRRVVAWTRSWLPLAPWACRLRLLPKHFWAPPPAPCLLAVARATGVTRIPYNTRTASAGTPVLTAANLNDSRILALLDELRPDAVVHTGGGILPREIIARAGRGALNAHNSVLPGYRGLDAAHWALLEGRADLVGVTGHLIDPGIDTGPVLVVRRLDVRAFPDPRTLRAAYWALMPKVLVEATTGLLQGRTPEPQTPGSRQYFALHPRLRPLVQLALDRARGVG
ncbi:MAG: formyltransferase family protein [Geminicoccaceae bacterium]